MITEEQVAPQPYQPDQITPESDLVVDNAAVSQTTASSNHAAEHKAADGCLKPHCNWCASQGLTEKDDDLFDMHFRTIVDAMRKHEGRITRETPPFATRAGRSNMREMMEDNGESTAISSSLAHAAWIRWGAIQSGLAVLILGIILIQFAGHPVVSNKAFSKLSSESFSTTTGSMKITLADGAANCSGVGFQSKQPVLYWCGTWQDEVAMVMGAFSHCTWLKASELKLQTQDGLMLFNSKAPELTVAANMRTLRDKAFRYYQAFGHYPESADAITNGPTYVNPLTKHTDRYEIKQVINGSLVSTSGSGSDARCAANKTNSHDAGTVWAVGVKSEPEIAADNNCYNWHNKSFYVYGSDRNGKALCGGAPDKDFVIALKNGKDETEVQLASPIKTNDKIILFIGDKPDANAIRWRYSLLCLTLLLLTGTVAVRLINSRLVEGQWARLKGKKA